MLMQHREIRHPEPVEGRTTAMQGPIIAQCPRKSATARIGLTVIRASEGGLLFLSDAAPGHVISASAGQGLFVHQMEAGNGTRAIWRPLGESSNLTAAASSF
jgi:hypothetical protein